jgi:hypothetical protein
MRRQAMQYLIVHIAAYKKYISIFVFFYRKKGISLGIYKLTTKRKAIPSMKAKNNSDVLRAIVCFSAYLLSSVVLAVGIYSSFMQTSMVEINAILKQTNSYDLVMMQQLRLTESVDSIYYYSTLLNSEDVYVNQSAMYNVLSARTIAFNNELEGMSSDDCLVYKKLGNKLGDLFLLKDSIRISQVEQEALRDEYVRCINRNKDMTQRLFTGSIY